MSTTPRYYVAAFSKDSLMDKHLRATGDFLHPTDAFLPALIHRSVRALKASELRRGFGTSGMCIVEVELMGRPGRETKPRTILVKYIRVVEDT